MKNFFLLAFLILFPFLSFSQLESEPIRFNKESPRFTMGTRVGLSSFKEANLFVEFPIKAEKDLIIEFAYKYGSNGFDGGSLFCFMSTLFNHSLKRKGALLKAGIRHGKESKSFERRTLGVLAYGVSKGIEKDEGCSSGSNSSDYKSYDVHAVGIGCMHYWDKKTRNDHFTFFCGIGGMIWLGEKRNVRSGSFSYHPVTGNEGFGAVTVPLDIGMKVNFFSLKKKK